MTDPPEPVRGRAITSPPPVLRRRRGIQHATPSAAAPRRQRGRRPGRPSSGRSAGFRDTMLRILPRTAAPSVTVAGSSRTPRPVAASSQSPSPLRRLSEDVLVIVGVPRVAADCSHADMPSVAVGGSRRRSSSAVASSAPASHRRRLSESVPAAVDMGLHRAAPTAHDPGALSVSAAFTPRPTRGRSTRPVPLLAHGLADDVPSSCRSANDGSLVAASAARAPDRARVRGSHDRISRTSVASVRSVVSASPSYSAALPHGLSTGLSGGLADNIDIGPLSAEQDARRREIALGKRPMHDMPVPCVDSSDDDSAGGWSAMFANFIDDDIPLSDWPRINPSSASRLSTPASWAPFPHAFSSSSVKPDGDFVSAPSEFYTASRDVLSDVDLDDLTDALPVGLSRVAPTPFVPAHTISSNQQMHMGIRRHRRLVRAGFRPGNVDLPLPNDFITLLKRSWPERSYYGGPHYVCPHCDASYWYQERCKHLSTKKKPVYTRCCRAGKISLPAYPDWPSPLAELLRFDGGTECSRFLRLIREYNSMFAFTSLGVQVDNSVNIGRGPYVFKICGVVCHEIGSLLPPEDNPVPKFAQLYIYDTQNELDHRMGIFSSDDADVDEVLASTDQFSSSSHSRGVQRDVQPDVPAGERPVRSVRRSRPRREEPDREVVDALRIMLNIHNSLVQTFRMAEQRLFSPDAPEVAIQLFGHEGAEHGNRYSLPVASELAALIVDEFSVEVNRFDIIVQKEAGRFQRVSPLNPSLMALQYPLLFPHASMSFHLGIKFRSVNGVPVRGRHDVSMLEYYCYRFQYRKEEPNPFTCCGRLSHQLKVDSFSCVESCRLSFHFWNQDSLRSESYQGISDAVGEGNSTGKNVGVEYILHSSYTGSPRYMIQNYQDGMAICRVHGAPDLFVTFTCNPKWDEISDALLMEPGQTAPDRPDIVTRVFKMKINEYSKDVRKGKTFGSVNAYLYVVEFQKRGLPHIHSLVWLKVDTEDPMPDTINSYISDPLAYALVEEFMVHGPCGEYNSKSPCMKNGVCSKHYPKEYNEETTIDGLGFPVYRRRKNGRFVMKNGIPLDNKWSVPYNISLLKKFQAHINVEWCNKTKLLKYLFKYLAKGHDMTRARLHSMYQTPGSESIGINEIDEYAKYRYLSTCEACWRTFAFDIHVREPSVHRLVVHLPNMNRIIYAEDDNLAEVISNPNKYKTMLTEWFTANLRYSDARSLTYLEFPSKWI